MWEVRVSDSEGVMPKTAHRGLEDDFALHNQDPIRFYVDPNK